MSSLESYNGLQVLTPEPSAAGGKAINDNFKALSTPLEAADPSASDDSTQGYSAGSRWYNTSTNVEWICTDPTAGSAVWQEAALVSPWVLSGTSIYYTGGYVGIGTASPSFPLTIATTGQIGILIENSDADTYNQLGFNGTSDYRWQIGTGNPSESTFGIPNKFFIFDNQQGKKRAVIDTAGNLGIGTTSPNGYSGYIGLTIDSPTAGGVMDINVNGTRNMSMYVNPETGGAFGTTANIPLQILANGSVTMFLDTSGNVGTTTPAATLEVNGTLQADGLFFPQQTPTSSAPAYVKGGVYFDTTLNKLRVGGASGWETVTSS